MLPKQFQGRCFATVLLSLAVFAAGVVLPAANAAAADAPAAAEPASGANAATDEPTPLREQSIYIPYEDLREIFEKEGRGVFVPYEQFQALWKAARQRTAPPEKQRPPVAALIAEIDSDATVKEEVVSVAARLKIEILSKGWQEVPLRLADTAISAATIDGEPARIVPGKDGYKLLVRSEDDTPKVVQLRLEYMKVFTKAPGQNSVSFQAPQAPVNRWRIRIPESGVKVDIQPLIAATELPPEAGAPADPAGVEAAADGETVVLAFVGAAPTVRIGWTPKAEGATGLEALATVQAEQEVRIDEGVMRTRTRLAYDISRAELAQLTIEVPADQDQEVLNVFDPNVRQWDVKVEDDKQIIEVQLFEPARGGQRVTVELERVSDELLADDVVIPVVRAANASRQQGVVVVALAPDLQAEALRRSGLTQVDRSELPAAMRNEEWAFAYRYAALPFDLALEVEKVQPRIRTDELVEAYVEPEQITLSHLALYTIERAGVFQLQLQVPAGFAVRDVRGYEAAGAKAAAFDSRQLSGPDQTQLTVNLSQKAIGKVGLLVELVRRLDDPNLLRPTGEESQITLVPPRVDPAGIERCTGRLVIYKPESLRVVAAEQKGLSDAISLAEVFKPVPSVRGNRFPATQPALTFAYTEQPASLTLTAQRRKPHVTARQLLVARIESGVVKYEATIFFDVRYSGVKSLRLDVPAELAPKITKRTESIEKDEFVPAADEEPALAEGYVAWRLTGESELLDEVKVELAWERKIAGELAVGKPLEFDLPNLKPVGDRAWGQIVIAKAETIDVRAAGDPQGLRMIDPQQNLMPGADVDDAALAFEFHEDDWQLKIKATRYELTKVNRTSIDRAVVRIVATLDNELIVQALYRLRSARQRVTVRLPDPKNVSFSSQPLRINGQAVDLEHGEGDDYFVPLVSHDSDKPLLLELRYTHKGSPARLDLPEFRDDPAVAVQKVFLCVYVPDRLALLGSRGPWTNEMTWQWNDPFRPRPVARCPEVNAMRWQPDGTLLSDDGALVKWVTEDVSVAGNPAADFPADGSPLVYSTLRPAPPPDGSLRLITTNRNWLHLLVFVVVAVIGLIFVARPVREKFAAVVAVAIALILCGVFAPTFAMQILGGAFLIAVILVLLLWLAALVFWGTQRGRSFLAAVISGRRSGDVVMRPITPPPAPPSPPVPGEPPRDLPDAESGDQASSDDAGEDGDAGDKPLDATLVSKSDADEEASSAESEKPSGDKTAGDKPLDATLVPESDTDEKASSAEREEPAADKSESPPAEDKDAPADDKGNKAEGGQTNA
jgi:hypothetical protein